jgi:cell division protein FtsI (penicillin-binding protein 3)
VDEPKTSSYGGVVAAPAFSAIARQSLCYLRVAANQPLKKKQETIEVKKEEPKLVAEAAEDLEEIA